MRIITKPILYVGNLGEKIIDSSFDTIANLSCINLNNLILLENVRNLGVVRQIVKTTTRNYYNITQVTCLDFYVNNVLISDEFLVVSNLKEAVIIGAATMRKWRIKLNIENDTVEIDPKVAKLILKNLI